MANPFTLILERDDGDPDAKAMRPFWCLSDKLLPRHAVVSDRSTSSQIVDIAIWRRAREQRGAASPKTNE